MTRMKLYDSRPDAEALTKRLVRDFPKGYSELLQRRLVLVCDVGNRYLLLCVGVFLHGVQQGIYETTRDRRVRRAFASRHTEPGAYWRFAPDGLGEAMDAAHEKERQLVRDRCAAQNVPTGELCNVRGRLLYDVDADAVLS